MYAERLPKEMGFYCDPYSQFGQLSSELWRACRLVVDTGLHDGRWSREQAISYLVETTPKVDAEAVRAVERYLVDPGQATAYTIGMQEILKLRRRAQSILGAAFDIRVFHDVLLRLGAMPLPLLTEAVLERLPAAAATAGSTVLESRWPKV